MSDKPSTAKAAALPVAFTSSMAESENVAVLKESSLTATASVSYSEKEKSSFKRYCKGENYLLYLSETSLYWQSIEGERSFLSNAIFDINLCVRISFPIHPWLSAVGSPEVNPGKGLLELPLPSHRCLPPQLNCPSRPMASED